MLAAEPPFLERAVHYEGVSRAMADAMLDLSRRAAQDALQRVNREAQTAYASDPGGSWRWNFGLYLFREDEAARRPAEAGPAAPPAPDANRGDAL